MPILIYGLAIQVKPDIEPDCLYTGAVLVKKIVKMSVDFNSIAIGCAMTAATHPFTYAKVLVQVSGTF